MSNRRWKISEIKPPYLNFQWLIGPSSIYIAKQQRTKWNHQHIYFSCLSMTAFNIIYIYINSFWDWAKIYHYHTHSFAIKIDLISSINFNIIAENARIGKNWYFRGHNSNTGSLILLNNCRQVELVMLINFSVYIEHLSLTVFKLKAENSKIWHFRCNIPYKGSSYNFDLMETFVELH